MSGAALVNHHQLRVTPQTAAWVGFAIVVLAVSSAWVGSARETFVVPHDKAPDLVALFGDAWAEPTGEFRVTGGRMEGGIVRVSLAAPGRSVSLTLEHTRARQPTVPDAVVVEHPGNDIRVVLVCTPACDAPARAQLRSLAEHVLAGQPGRLWVAARGFAIGRERTVAVALVLGLYCAAASLGCGALWRARPYSCQRLADAFLVCALCAVATALLGEPSIANWYSDNLPAVGGIVDAEDQNGMAGFFLQAFVRSMLPWTDRTLFALNFFLHATAGGVFYLVFRALVIERDVSWLALLLWAVLPLSVRVGWSDAQHVQVELFFALLLLVWLRAQDSRNWPERMLAPVLAALLPLVRLEAVLLAPLPLLFGPLVGDRSPTRRLVDALVYLGGLAFSVCVVFELFVRRYDIPVPDPALAVRALLHPPDHLDLFRQFLFVNSGMPNWFPEPATALLVIGVAVLAARHPARLVALLAAFVTPQLLLGRFFNAEGMVGARYFLPLLALLALVAASGVATVAALVRRVLAHSLSERTVTWVAHGAAVLGVLTVVPASLPLYHYKYAFQGEEEFLRAALATLPPDARVLHLPVRFDDRIHLDPDCCLDPPNSPLALAFPLVHFESLPIHPERPRLPAAVDDHTYYYEGALCRLAPTPASEGRNPGLSHLLRGLCAALASDPRLEPVATAQVPSNGFWPFLESGDVPLALHRIRPTAQP